MPTPGTGWWVRSGYGHADLWGRPRRRHHRCGRWTRGRDRRAVREPGLDCRGRGPHGARGRRRDHLRRRGCHRFGVARHAGRAGRGGARPGRRSGDVRRDPRHRPARGDRSRPRAACPGRQRDGNRPHRPRPVRTAPREPRTSGAHQFRDRAAARHAHERPVRDEQARSGGVWRLPAPGTHVFGHQGRLGPAWAVPYRHDGVHQAPLSGVHTARFTVRGHGPR